MDTDELGEAMHRLETLPDRLMNRLKPRLLTEFRRQDYKLAQAGRRAGTQAHGEDDSFTIQAVGGGRARSELVKHQLPRIVEDEFGRAVRGGIGHA